MNKILALIFVLFVSISQTFALDYDFSDTDCVKIPLKINQKITTGKINKSYEGQPLTFTVEYDVFYNKKKIVKSGTQVTARLAMMTTRGFAGVPGELFITDISIPNLDNRKIMQPVSHRGFSTTTLILPIKWALTPFPPFGTLTNIMVGGNATLTPRETLYIDYYPNYIFNN